MAAVNQDNTLAVATTTAPSNSKQSQPRAKTVDSQSVLKRLQSELMALMMSGDSGISAFPEEDNIFCWKGTIIGSKDTVFEGTEYRLSLTFPNDYPFKPPKVKFETLCFHPNVDLVGNICLDILQDKWSSAYDVRTILLSIQSLLGEPNISSPLNNQAAQLWSNQDGKYWISFCLFVLIFVCRSRRLNRTNRKEKLVLILLSCYVSKNKLVNWSDLSIMDFSLEAV